VSAEPALLCFFEALPPLIILAWQWSCRASRIPRQSIEKWRSTMKITPAATALGVGEVAMSPIGIGTRWIES
jgi:hypothetical protein